MGNPDQEHLRTLDQFPKDMAPAMVLSAEEKLTDEKPEQESYVTDGSTTSKEDSAKGVCETLVVQKPRWMQQQDSGYRPKASRKKMVIVTLLVVALLQFLRPSALRFEFLRGGTVAIETALRFFSSMFAIGASLITGGPVAKATVKPINETQYPDWHKYVRSPNSKTVLPVSVLSNGTNNGVDNPDGLLAQGGGVTTFTRAKGPDPPMWPKGTNVTASSTHSGDYSPMNAIDGDVDTFWNDDTIAAYPDVLTIVAPTSQLLPGITIVSNKDGVPVNFTVDILPSSDPNGTWSQIATITNNSAIKIQVNFTAPVQTYGIRINVTQSQSSGAGEYTRIAEVYPGILPPDSPVPAVVVDFGMVVAGWLSISFAGASANVPGIRLAFSETMEYLTDVSDFSRSYNGDTITPGSDQIAVNSDPYVWTDEHGCLDNGKVCADGLHGFRYVKIYLDALRKDSPFTTAYGEVQIDAIWLEFSPFLGTPDTFKGYFQCSDDTLTQYWFDGAYTNDLNIDTFRANDTEPRNAASPSLIGKLVIHDGPKRDRDPYIGDLAVSGRTVYVTHDQESIAVRNVLADVADHQRADGWIPPASINNYTLPLFDYPLWWVTSSYDYMLYMNDFSYITQYYPNLVKLLDTFYPSVTDPTTGLLKKGLGVTQGYGDFAFLPRTGIITYYNALYVLALQNAASLAQTYGYPDDAERWTERSIRIAQAINTVLWDPVVGAYLDNPDSTTHGQDGNMLAILSGVANYKTRSASILDYWASLALPYGNPFFSNDDLSASGEFSSRVYAFISYFELCSRFETPTYADSAIEEISRLYGWMSTHDPGITFWEGIGKNGSQYEGPYTSDSHGWSSGVTPALTNYVLGVTPTAPGFEEWKVKPVPVSGVTWARGMVNTPKGGLNVSWSSVDLDLFEFQVQVEAPANTKGTISVPVSRETVVVFVGGVPAWTGWDGVAYGAKYSYGYVTVDVSGGSTVVSVGR